MAAKQFTSFRLIMLFAIMLNLVGCSSPNPDVQATPFGPQSEFPPSAKISTSTPEIKVKMASADIQRDAPSIDKSLVDQQVKANNEFAFDLYQSLKSSDSNLFYSPSSLSTALAMIYAGARNETERQMASTLHYVLPQDQLHRVFNFLDQSLNSGRSAEPGFQLNVVNSLWGQDDFPFLPDYLTILARNYDAGIRLVDFTSPANRETARLAINEWVSQQTQEKIKDLLAEGMLDDNTRLILVNAIYFKGEWVEPFNKGTKDVPFTLEDGNQVTVQLMAQRAETPYYQGNGFQAVAIPYKGGRAEMIVILPDRGKFEEFEDSFNQQVFDDIRSKLEVKDVRLHMPKFSFGYSADMKHTLSAMGMPLAFDWDRADFSGIYDHKIVQQNLFISHIAHKAFVAVDEMGTEAAAASGIIAEIVSMPIMLYIDHPFIFVIRDRQTGSILFVGRVLNPSLH